MKRNINKFVGAALALFLLASAALPVAAKTETTAPVPTLTLAYGSEKLSTAQGDVTWKNQNGETVTTDVAHPLDRGFRMPIVMRRPSLGSLELSFSTRPDMISVSRWDLSARGKTVIKPIADTPKGYILTIPSQGAYIYEVTGKWSSGEVSYVFEFGLPGDSTRMALKDLPRRYSVELARANGDVVWTPSPARIDNPEKLDAFLVSVLSKMPASVRVVSFRGESNPTIYDLAYNGDKIRCTADATRDLTLEKSAREITEKEYAKISVEDEYSDEAGFTVSDVVLTDTAGKKLTIARYIPIELDAQQKSYPADTKEITVNIKNVTCDEVSYDAVFTLDRLTSGKWTPIKFEAAFEEWAGLIKPGATATCEVALSKVGGMLSTGKYRVNKVVFDGNRRLRVSAPFSIERASDQLEISAPVSINVSIGNGKSMINATLTRTGKYRGISPVEYVTRELQQFRPLPSGWKMVYAAETDRGALTLDYSDGSEIKVTIDPTGGRATAQGEYLPMTILSVGGKTYYSDREAYSRIRDCAADVAKK